MKKGQKVVDFGCGEGVYSILSGMVVGENGVVYAVDEQQKDLDIMVNKAKGMGLKNIKTVTKNEFKILSNKVKNVDFILLFDVLHYFTKDQRKKLYDFFYDLLDVKGKLVVYPKHTKNNFPLWNLSEISNKDLQKEIEKSQFYLKKFHETTLIHSEKFEKGNIFIFEKR
ncbi:MAG: class I SAM-dependent methyltransferase [Candidatus Thermoplasmatota archaeon]|nr:class I SAM-dependent methyltransferase [Candidatus Thermoplasmatota archaeon]